ncbi:hypothetical protein ACF0H5_014649 [Mactra antiquata]
MKHTNKGWTRAVVFLFVLIMVGIYVAWEVVRKPITHANYTSVWSEDFFGLMPKLQNSSKLKIDTVSLNDAQKQYDLRMIAIVYNRANSLKRLLKSINGADFGKDSIKLEVWIDRSKEGKFDTATIDAAVAFEFKHGDYSVNIHTEHVGIYGQWLSTWKPQLNSSEIAVILEDDLTVSPHFYKYLKLVHKKYDNVPEINGYALQGHSIKHFVHDTSTLVGPKDSHVFLYPVLGTWGFSPNTKNWIKFLDWFAVAHSDKDFVPDIPNNIVSNWYRQFIQSGKSDGMWSIWHIYYAWEHMEYTLYCNFPAHLGLTVNWKEPGLHYSGQASKPSNGMLTTWRDEYENLPDNPSHLNIAGNKIPV